MENLNNSKNADCACQGMQVGGDIKGKGGILGTEHCITVLNYHPDGDP